MRAFGLYLLGACTGETSETVAPPVAPLVAAESGQPVGAETVVPPPTDRPASVVVVEAPGWGAIFWKGEDAWRLGPGTIAIGPDAIGPVRDDPSRPPRCEATAIAAAPHAAPILLPPDVKAPEAAPPRPPAVPAATIERAAWRLDEVLPAADRFTPQTPSKDVSNQRGVQLGTVVKVRHFGGPPWLVVSGTRTCEGAFALLNQDASKVLVSDRIPTCETLHVMSPSDLDGDGNLEFVVFNDDTVVLYRIVDGQRVPVIEKLGQWTCRP